MSLNSIKVNNSSVIGVDDKPIVGSQNLIKSDSIVTYNTNNPNRWCIGKSNEIKNLNISQQSLFNWIVDMSFEPKTEHIEKFQSEDWFIKLGIVCFDENNLENLSKFAICLYLTTGTGTYYTFGHDVVNIEVRGDHPIGDFNLNQYIIKNKYKPCLYKLIFGTAGILNIILDFNKLDFSTFPTKVVDYDYLLLNHGLSKNYYIAAKKLSSNFALAENAYSIGFEHDKQLFSNMSWLQQINGSRSDNNVSGFIHLSNAIIDVFITDVTDTLSSGTGSFYDNDYYIKLGWFGFDGTTLDESTKLWSFFYFTDGEWYDTSSTVTIDILHRDIIHIVQTIHTKTGSFDLHTIVNLRKLDFALATFTVTIQSIKWYGFCNVGLDIDKAMLINKRVGSPIYACNTELNQSPLPIATNVVTNKFNMIDYLCKFYKFMQYDNILCCGDSVTAGAVIEGTQTHPDSINTVMINKAYPTGLNKLMPKSNVTIAARSGISSIGWLQDFYPTLNFADYELVILELGLNGGLNINDIDISGTQTNAYKQIVAGMRQQNTSMPIFLVRSSHFVTNIISVLNTLAEQYNCNVIDLQSDESKQIIDLDNEELHGWTRYQGNIIRDWAHFTRKGYMCKAYVISRMIENRLSNITEYD